MLGASGLISGIRRSTTRAIPSKQSEARLRAAAAKKAENPIPMEAKVRSRIAVGGHKMRFKFRNSNHTILSFE